MTQAPRPPGATTPTVAKALPAHRPATRLDEVAYVAPMAVFVAFTIAGGKWQAFYPASYVIKTVIVAALLIIFRKRYTPIRWKHWPLGALVGALTVIQWVGMEKLLPHYPKMAHDVFDPTQQFTSRGLSWAFIAVRWAGASLLVPFMEELFWRDYLWRTIASPNDFKRVPVGVWDVTAFFAVAIIFGAGVHIEWLTAIVCGLIYGGLLLWTRSLGACIVAHGVTNFLLGAYVLVYRDWVFW